MTIDWTVFKDYLPQIVATAVAIALLPILKYVSRKLTRKYGTMLGKSDTRIRQIRYIIAVLVNITFVFVVAVIWGVRPQNLLLGLSSVLAFLGVALFAQWSVLSNVTAGIVMFFSAPYHVGSAIKIIDKDIPIEATIELIGTFYTHIRTVEGQLIVIPNSLFLQKVVGIKQL